MDGCIDRQKDEQNFPLCSTGHRPLSGPLPKKRRRGDNDPCNDDTKRPLNNDVVMMISATMTI